jgi:hypothetical protein
MKARSGISNIRRRDRALSALGLALLRRRHATGTGAEPAPLFIIGSGRSGNTLVRRVIMSSGAIYIPPETFVLGDIIEGWLRTGLLTWRERVWLFCAHFEKHVFFPTFQLDNLNDFAEEAIALPADNRTVKTLIETFYRHLARAHGSDASRWGDKTPYNTFHLPALQAVFPDAQYLWLVRDGRDVALSYVEAGLFDTLEAAADRWTTANHACAGLAARCPNVYRQSYEGLVSDPEESFRAICAWAGLPFSPEMLTAQGAPMGDVEALMHHRNVTRPISAASVGRWRTGLKPADMAQVSGEFWDMMTEMGYDHTGADS